MNNTDALLKELLDTRKRLTTNRAQCQVKLDALSGVQLGVEARREAEGAYHRLIAQWTHRINKNDELINEVIYGK